MGAKGTIIGRYLVGGEIASGGMGAVSIAKVLGDGPTGGLVAVKRLHDQHARDPEIVAMLFDEARIVRHIEHPNVVVVHELVEVDGDVLLAMEYVEGEALAGLLAACRARGESVPDAIAVAVLGSVLAGLHAAHEATDDNGVPLCIVHRDVSPQNVLVDVAGRTRVTDFGVAKAVGRMQTTTEQGSIKGKLRYMSPEQFAGQAVDRRADVWAVGVMLWEMLSGHALFEDAPAAMRFFGGEGEVPPPSSQRRVPEALERVASRALRRRAAERYETAREMAEALALACAPAGPEEVGAWTRRLAATALHRRAGVAAQLEALDPADVERDEIVTPTRVERLRRESARPESSVATVAERPKRRSGALAFAGLVAVAATSGIAYLATRGAEPPPSEAVHGRPDLADSGASVVGAAEAPSSSASEAAPPEPRAAPSASTAAKGGRRHGTGHTRTTPPAKATPSQGRELRPEGDPELDMRK